MGFKGGYRSDEMPNAMDSASSERGCPPAQLSGREITVLVTDSESRVLTVDPAVWGAPTLAS